MRPAAAGKPFGAAAWPFASPRRRRQRGGSEASPGPWLRGFRPGPGRPGGLRRVGRSTRGFASAEDTRASQNPFHLYIFFQRTLRRKKQVIAKLYLEKGPIKETTPRLDRVAHENVGSCFARLSFRSWARRRGPRWGSPPFRLLLTNIIRVRRPRWSQR